MHEVLGTESGAENVQNGCRKGKWMENDDKIGFIILPKTGHNHWCTSGRSDICQLRFTRHQPISSARKLTNLTSDWKKIQRSISTSPMSLRTERAIIASYRQQDIVTGCCKSCHSCPWVHSWLSFPFRSKEFIKFFPWPAHLPVPWLRYQHIEGEKTTVFLDYYYTLSSEVILPNVNLSKTRIEIHVLISIYYPNLSMYRLLSIYDIIAQNM